MCKNEIEKENEMQLKLTKDFVVMTGKEKKEDVSEQVKIRKIQRTKK